MREPPRPGTDLYCYWRETADPQVGEEHDISLGDWTIRVRLTRVKDSEHVPNRKHVSMEVIG